MRSVLESSEWPSKSLTYAEANFNRQRTVHWHRAIGQYPCVYGIAVEGSTRFKIREKGDENITPIICPSFRRCGILIDVYLGSASTNFEAISCTRKCAVIASILSVVIDRIVTD